MAKKKQLAGKETKLAKLPLTQALAHQNQEPARPGPPEPPPLLKPQVAAPAVEPGKEQAARFAAAYFHLIKELAALRSELQPAGANLAFAPAPLPTRLPEPNRIREALVQAQKGLQDLHQFLALKDS